MKKLFLFFVLVIYLCSPSWASEDLRKGLKELEGFLAAGLAAYRSGNISEAEGNFSDAL